MRVPYADGSLQHAPARLDDSLLIKMCDIFPTDYYGAMRAIEFSQRPLLQSSGFVAQPLDEAVFVILGCEPMGICALLTAKTKGVGKIYVVDSVEERLAEAEKVGGIPLKLGHDDILKIVKENTGGCGQIQ